MRKEKRKKSGLFRFLFILLLLLGLLAGGFYLATGFFYEKMTYQKAESRDKESYREDGVIHILLIGSDAREGVEGDRSDAMILLSVSSKTQKLIITSLLRDMYVEIPGHDGNRLNAAYAYGGPELLMETIEQNFDIPVNRYVLVNFEAFAALVDAAGGAELSVTAEEINYINGYLVEYNQITGRPEGTDYLDPGAAGELCLNGPQALAYSRIRYIGTDFGRTERQRKVLSAVLQKLPSVLLSNPEALLERFLPNLTTNLTRNECFALGLQAGRALFYEKEQGSIPIEGSYRDASIRGMAVLEVDFEQSKAWLKERLYGEE